MTPHRNRVAIFVIPCCLLFLMVAVAQDSTTPISSKRVGVEDRADEILRRMSTYLGSAREFSFQVTNMVDHVLDNGQKIQLSDRSQCSVHRPDRMAVRITGDTRDEAFWYDGKTLTLCDHRAGEHGDMEVHPTIEQMLDYLATEYEMVVPLAELFFEDCYQAVIGNVLKGTYVGLHQVQGVKCHHLAFRQAFIDWQIWIEDGAMPVPRKVVITYRETIGQPQYTALLDHWNIAPKLAEDLFKPQIPDQSKKMDIRSALFRRSPSTPAGTESHQ